MIKNNKTPLFIVIVTLCTQSQMIASSKNDFSSWSYLRIGCLAVAGSAATYCGYRWYQSIAPQLEARNILVAAHYERQSKENTVSNKTLTRALNFNKKYCSDKNDPVTYSPLKDSGLVDTLGLSAYANGRANTEKIRIWSGRTIGTTLVAAGLYFAGNRP